jgi:hypothetical protein
MERNVRNVAEECLRGQGDCRCGLDVGQRCDGLSGRGMPGGDTGLLTEVMMVRVAASRRSGDYGVLEPRVSINIGVVCWDSWGR